jgi:hypothetical protein
MDNSELDQMITDYDLMVRECEDKRRKLKAAKALKKKQLPKGKNKRKWFSWKRLI